MKTNDKFDYLAPESEVIRIQTEIRFLNYGNPQIPSGEEVEGGDY